MISALPVSGAAQPNTIGAQPRPAEHLVEQRELQLAVALAAELRVRDGGPQVLSPHLVLQLVDEALQRLFQR